MRRLFQFLVRSRNILLFVALEVAALAMVVSSRRYHNAAFLNASDRLVAGVEATGSQISSYFSLEEQNEVLLRENAVLRQRLANLEKQALDLEITQLGSPLDSSYNVVPARVVGKALHRDRNYLTIDKGWGDGVRPGMAVIGDRGVVGRVQNASKHYATISTLLHPDVVVSSEVRRNGVVGAVRWTGHGVRSGEVDFVPRHLSVKKGDTLVTSGYNALFPPGIPVGQVVRAELLGHETFYEIDLRYFTEFVTIDHLYVIENKNRGPQQALEALTQDQGSDQP